MSSAYRHLALADVRPGMVLSDVLLDRQGQVLLPQGAILTAPIIALLPRHGIEALAVLRHTDSGDSGAHNVGIANSADSDEAAPDYAMLQQRLAHLFRRNGIRNRDGGNDAPDDRADSASATLQRYMTDYRLGRERAE